MISQVRSRQLLKQLNQIRLQSSSTSQPPKLSTTPNKYNSKSSAFNLKPVLPSGLFYHPSPSSPNPELTPKAFLPNTDPRKNSSLYYPEQITKETISYMPVVSKPRGPTSYALEKAQIIELQNARDNGVTRKQMRETFKVSDHFINIATKPNPKTVKLESKRVKRAMKGWSKETLKAKETKAKLQSLWERDM